MLARRRNLDGIGRLFGAAALIALAGCGGGSAGVEVAQSPGTAPAPAPTPLPPAPSPPAPVPGTSSAIGDCEMFPPTAIFNTRIDDVARFPAHANNATWIGTVGTSMHMHADWGTNDDPAQAATYWGIPINVVDGTSASTAWPVVSYDFTSSGVSSDTGWPDESDCAVAGASGFTLTRNCSAVPASDRRFPFPQASSLRVEGGACNDPTRCGDHHVLVVEQGACRLWESYFAYSLSNRWYALATAAWDLKSLALRPVGWTSGDAAGLPITPLLARASEAAAGEVRHPLRVTLRDSVLARGYVWPARHAAGGDTPGGIPFGALLRLKAGFAIPSDWTPQARALATAMMRYGMYVADIGSDFFVQGEPNAAWDARTISQLQTITLGQMEFVSTDAVTRDPRFSPDSLAAGW